MDIAQLEEMLKRRGYGKPFIKSMNACYAPGVLVPTEVIEVAVPGYEEDFPICSYHYLIGHTTVSMAKTLDSQLGVSHHHIVCSCGLPILRKPRYRTLAPDEMIFRNGGYVETREAPVKGSDVRMSYTNAVHPHSVDIMMATDYEYRLVSAGPESEVITHCPQCGLMLIESICEIED